jgi:hypothetical protein
MSRRCLRVNSDEARTFAAAGGAALAAEKIEDAIAA